MQRVDALARGQITSRVPGTHQTKTTKNVEWVCPECDYFEDAEAEDIEGG